MCKCRPSSDALKTPSFDLEDDECSREAKSPKCVCESCQMQQSLVSQLNGGLDKRATLAFAISKAGRFESRRQHFVIMFWILVLHLAVSCGQLFTRAEGTLVRIGASGDQVGVSGEILAIETRQPGESLFGRQMTNGKDLLKLIYVMNGRQLAACERFQGETPELSLFLRHFSNLTSLLQQGQGEGTKFKDADFNWPPINWHRSWNDCVRLQDAKRSGGGVHSPRSRRSAPSMILPGTTWCGVGNRSNGGDAIEGVRVETDRCCRLHDLCPRTIEGFTRKYNYYNFRFHTISYCECDASFRRCLQMAGDEHSHLVGHLFFNVIQMKCFTLQLEDVCAERAWWGRCTRTIQEPTAYIRDATPYNY